MLLERLKKMLEGMRKEIFYINELDE